MKVLHINSFYNGSMFYKNFYDQQLNDGLDIQVYVPVPKIKRKVSDVDMGGYTKISANHGQYDRYIFHLKHNKIYKDIIKEYTFKDISVIHAHSLFSNGYIAMKLKEKYDIPYIVAVRNTDINYFFKKMPHLRKTGLKILTQAKSIITLSHSYKEILIKNYIPNVQKDYMKGKISTIPNGISNYWFDNMGTTKDITNNKEIKLLQVGVIDKNKNIISTIKAIDILKKWGYDISFTVVGKIKDESIFNQIKDLSFIKFISPVRQEELKSIYRKNHIFIMPSITETFGLVYAEAMSQGLPVLYSKGQGFDGQFENGDVGFSVESRNPQDIAEKILAVLNEYEDISNRCIMKSKKFMWSEISKTYIKKYGELIHE